jgi:hypothetical protein
VETLFWFHPLVWWLGTRLVAERERACDEAVIQSGNDRQTYAEGILKVCRLYVGAPLWTATVSGGALRKRIEDIMQNPISIQLSLAKRGLLSLTVGLLIAAPVAAGLWGGAAVAQAEEANSMAVKHYRNSEWKFALDLPGHWQAIPPRSANNSDSRMVMSFGSSDSSDRLLIVTRHSYVPSKETLKTILDSAEQDMARSGFLHFVPGEPVTIGAKRAIRLDSERAPKDGEGVWYCRNYYILGSHGAYILAFGARNITAAQRDAVFNTYDRIARSFVFEDL